MHTWLIYSVVLVSGVQQSDSYIQSLCCDYIYIYMCVCVYVCVCEYMDMYRILHILFHYDLLKNIEYSSLCYTVGLHCVSIL